MNDEVYEATLSQLGIEAAGHLSGDFNARNADPEFKGAVKLRASIFRNQLEKYDLHPFLTLPGTLHSKNGCLSCGEPISSENGQFRCPLCQEAVLLALGITPSP